MFKPAEPLQETILNSDKVIGTNPTSLRETLLTSDTINAQSRPLFIMPIMARDKNCDEQMP